VRLLALDVGDVRIGVALSDETGTLASGLATLKAAGPRKDAQSVASLVREHGAGEVVVGLPLRLDGSLGPQGEKVLAFVERLRRVLRVPVVTRDERLTSVAADERLAEAGVRRRDRKARIDQAAAALILQELLDERRPWRPGGRRAREASLPPGRPRQRRRPNALSLLALVGGAWAAWRRRPRPRSRRRAPGAAGRATRGGAEPCPAAPVSPRPPPLVRLWPARGWAPARPGALGRPPSRASWTPLGARRPRPDLPEGKGLDEIAALVAGEGVGLEAFLAAARDPSPVRDLDPMATDLEGYLFPDTYDLPQSAEAPRALVRRMTGRFREVISPELDRIAEKGLTVRQVVTLASIVELETAHPDERPRIAAVFLNRLRTGMPLQTDPSVIYALKRAGRWDGNIRKRDLEIDSPYNTYRRPGLPPGPLGSPGREAIRAVLEPAETKELYFVSRNDGTHEFSETLVQHNRAVDRYQRRRASS
jgi:putative transcription antitermination factor YqgF